MYKTILLYDDKFSVTKLQVTPTALALQLFPSVISPGASYEYSGMLTRQDIGAGLGGMIIQCQRYDPEAPPPSLPEEIELLSNRGFEAGDLRGWTPDMGNPAIESGRRRSGTYSARNYISGDQEIRVMYQEADVSAYAAAIDGGDAEISASGWCCGRFSHDQYWRLQISFLTAAHEIINYLVYTDYVMTNNGVWKQRIITDRPVPTLTRFIRLIWWEKGYREGYDMDGYFDDASLILKTLALAGGWETVASGVTAVNGSFAVNAVAPLVYGSYNCRAYFPGTVNLGRTKTVKKMRVKLPVGVIGDVSLLLYRGL